MRAHEINALDNFIGGWYLDDTTICDELIEYHRDSPHQHRGVMGSGGEAVVATDAKDSTDVMLTPSPVGKRYVQMLRRVAEHYVEKYPWSGKLVPWDVLEPIAIQHYAPGGGYKVWHFERDNSSEQIARRHLAFMTYLNDVDDAGGTEFLHQHLTVKPEKGLTLIWPVEWNFTHRGIVSNTEDKYIITGWFSTYTKAQFERVRQRLAGRQASGP